MISPILSVIALAVLLESGLPILFLQTRVGRNGQLFRLVKIRTMRSETKRLRYHYQWGSSGHPCGRSVAEIQSR